MLCSVFEPVGSTDKVIQLWLDTEPQLDRDLNVSLAPSSKNCQILKVVIGCMVRFVLLLISL